IARAILEEGRHVLLAGEGAARFAVARGFEPADPASMITDSARRRLEEVLRGRADGHWPGGTVGAVARDAQGHLAAATSTGGTVGKAPGRVGDSPIPGAGTYADNASGAASATGEGEAILRVQLCRSACDLLLHGLEAPRAASQAIAHIGGRIKGRAGIILIDRNGQVGIAHNTETMSWAIASPGELKSGWRWEGSQP
ncbi:MAG: isoaspartyl peptidase/L-asparaginase, partial [Sandaracinaceae bacterium]|nr:isoaspartyl peptidase/L-asparaginase [Sandaracinaceae bacterium]